jgi:hypothetical protein
LNSSLNEKLPLAIPKDLAISVIQSSEFVNHGLPAEYLPVTLRIYVEALQLIWYVLIPMSGLGLLSSCFVKHYSVRRQKEMRGELPKTEGQAGEHEAVVVNIPSKETDEIDSKNHNHQETIDIDSKSLNHQAEHIDTNRKTEAV